MFLIGRNRAVRMQSDSSQPRRAPQGGISLIDKYRAVRMQLDVSQPYRLSAAGLRGQVACCRWLLRRSSALLS